MKGRVSKCLRGQSKLPQGNRQRITITCLSPNNVSVRSNRSIVESKDTKRRGGTSQ